MSWTEKHWFYPADFFFLKFKYADFTGRQENEGRKTLILSLQASPAQERPVKLSNAHSNL